MLKYLGMLIAVFALAVYVAAKDEQAAKDAAHKTAQQSNAVPIAKPDANHPKENQENPEGNLPSWYGFFRWPNGTTTWAIILTLLAVAEQTQQTAKAAKASQTAAEAARDQVGKMDGQLNEMRLQREQAEKVWKEQSDTALISVKAATVGAMAADENAKAALQQIQMMKDKERARIQVTPLDFETVDADGPNNIGLEFVNIGPTIAFDVKVDAGGRVIVTGLEAENGEYGDLAVSRLLKPAAPDSSRVVCCFPKGWEDEVLYGKAKIRIEVFGEVRYIDVFGDIHTEEFSFRMGVWGLSQMPNRQVRLKPIRKWHPFPRVPSPEIQQS